MGPMDLLGLDALSDSSPPKSVVGPSSRVYGGRALVCLRPHHFPRRQIIHFVEWSIFEPFIFLIILANCATMAWQSPLDPQGTWKSGFIDSCESVFLAVFTLELLTKMLAYGVVFHRDAYLRDPWCQLDFCVVALVRACHERCGTAAPTHTPAPAHSSLTAAGPASRLVPSHNRARSQNHPA